MPFDPILSLKLDTGLLQSFRLLDRRALPEISKGFQSSTMTNVKAAVLERSRRSTAGKRMSSLVGKAQEDDEAFWSHSIWYDTGGGFSDKGSRTRRRGEDGGSKSSSGSEGADGGVDDGGLTSDGEDSYRMSDEDSDAVVDEFDSDFDESESEEVESDEEGEGEEERELRAQERQEAVSKRKKSQRLGAPSLKSSAGRELMKKKTGRITRHGPLGEGWNAGLVLNWPPSTVGADPAARAKTTMAAAAPRQILDSNPTACSGAQALTSMPVDFHMKPQHLPPNPAIYTGQPPRRFPMPPSKRKLRTGTPSPPSSPTKPTTCTKFTKRQRQTATNERKKSQRRRFKQEEMIIECIQSTETENARWLGSRRRSKEEVAQSEEIAAAAESRRFSSGQRLMSRFHSRRGCNNTLTFMDMDHLPKFLTRKNHIPSRSRIGSFGEHQLHHRCSVSTSQRRRLSSNALEPGNSLQETNHEKCVITGMIARYRDPKTMLGYHDAAAFRELRQQFKAGNLKVWQPGCSNNWRRKPGSSTDEATNRTRLKKYSPFPVDQPVMVAKIISKGLTVKVIVTQGGVPVSPPSNTKIPSKLSRKVSSLADAPRKGLAPLPSMVCPNGNFKTVDGNNFDKNKTHTVSIILHQSSLAERLRAVTENEQIRQLPSQDNSKKVSVDNFSSKIVSKEVLSSELRTAYFAQPAELGKRIEPAQNQRPVGNDVASNGNRDNVIKPPATVSSSFATQTTSAMIEEGRTNGTVDMETAITFNTGRASSEKAEVPPTTKDNIGRSTATGDNGNSESVPDITTPNDKRTTIEAN